MNILKKEVTDMKLYGKLLVHGCDIPGFNKKIEIYHPDDAVHMSIKGQETHEAWYEDGEPIIIQCKHNKIEGITILGGVLTEVQCVFNKQLKALQTVITYDNSDAMYEELRQFTLDNASEDE